MSHSSSYRGRLAPSPTGLLHLGHARTFGMAAARAAAGTLVLRNEDLDPLRARAAYATAMIEDLRWLGLTWDEGPDAGGPCGPYLQSSRRPLYLAAWRLLMERGSVYPCRCSRRQLRERVQAPHEPAGEEDDEPVYPGSCRPASGSRQAYGAFSAPAGVNWRFRVPDGEPVCFEDANFGERRYVAGQDFGDFLIWRRDDVPAYQLAVVVDDAAMGITEVVRGADLLKSTARQLLLYRALGLDPPAWFHCPLVTDAQGNRLAKRTDALSLRALRDKGCSPKAVIGMARGTATESLDLPCKPGSLH
jgi:glutamyl-tRNA synthetase